jgi:hypothetical protein
MTVSVDHGGEVFIDAMQSTDPDDADKPNLQVLAQ